MPRTQIVFGVFDAISLALMLILYAYKEQKKKPRSLREMERIIVRAWPECKAYSGNLGRRGLQLALQGYVVYDSINNNYSLTEKGAELVEKILCVDFVNEIYQKIKTEVERIS